MNLQNHWLVHYGSCRLNNSNYCIQPYYCTVQVGFSKILGKLAVKYVPTYINQANHIRTDTYMPGFLTEPVFESDLEERKQNYCKKPIFDLHHGLYNLQENQHINAVSNLSLFIYH